MMKPAQVITFCFRQACSMTRYSQILFCRFFAPWSNSGLMLSSPMNTWLQPARAAFSMKPGILWQSVSTCRISLIGMP